MKKKIKVLQVIPRLGYGGAETGCYDLAHFLPEQGWKSFIVTSGGDLLQYVNKKKVSVIKLPVHSKNPILILFNTIMLFFIILFYNIDIVHARSRAPAWSCFLATKLSFRKFVTTFHGTYNFNNKVKKFYNSIMTKSDLVIAGSNFIFSHINENYAEYFLKKQNVTVKGVDNNMRMVFFGPGGDVSSTILRLSAYKNYSHTNIDITNKLAVDEAISSFQPDLLIHCAAQPSHDKAADIPHLDFEVNANGTLNLLESFRNHCSESSVFIHVSPNKVYGDGPNYLDLTEGQTRYDFADEKYKNGIIFI